MNKNEKRYFEHLVLYNQAKTQLEKEHHFEELRSFSGSELHRIHKTQYALYENWYNIVLRELLNAIHIYENSDDTAKEISKLLWPSVKPADVKKALDTLFDVGVITQDKRGRIRPTTKLITSGLDIPQVTVNKILRQFFELGVGSLDRFAKNDRLCSSVSVSVNNEGFDKISEKIAQCRKEIMTIAAANKGSLDRVYHMNFQLFPVTKKLSGVKK